MKKRIKKLKIPKTKYQIGLRELDGGNFIELKMVGEKVNEIIDYLNTRDSITVDGTLYRSMKRELDSYKWKESEDTVVELMVCTKHGKTICEECIQGGEWEKRMVHIEPKTETLVESVERKYNIDLGVDKETKLEELLKQKGLPAMSKTLEDIPEEGLKDTKLVASWVYDGDKWKEQDTPEESIEKVYVGPIYREMFKDTSEEWEVERYLDKILVNLLTDKKIQELMADYRFTVNWQKAKRADAVMSIKKYLFDGIKLEVKQLLEEREAEAREEGREEIVKSVKEYVKNRSKTLLRMTRDDSYYREAEIELQMLLEEVI